jgi:hypothetical protein
MFGKKYAYNFFKSYYIDFIGKILFYRVIKKYSGSFAAIYGSKRQVKGITI